MTDMEVMYHRFSRQNMKRHTGQLCKELGLSRKEYEDAVRRGMAQEQEQLKERRLERLKADFANAIRKEVRAK